MKKLRLLSNLFFIFFTLNLSAQSISGIVKDKTGEKMEFITVLLLNVKDSSLVKGAITDVEGKFDIKNMPSGRYFLSASGTGFAKTNTQAFDYKGDSYTLEPIVLKQSDTELAAVTVTSSKPLIEIQADKFVVNVEGSINATGSNALELLQKTPSVQVDQDDNVSLEGKQGVRIYIDGRPSPLSGRDLAAVLKSMQSSDIEAIEIITNPSAKYDAAGNVGIINIRLKKNK